MRWCGGVLTWYVALCLGQELQLSHLIMWQMIILMTAVVPGISLCGNLGWYLKLQFGRNNCCCGGGATPSRAHTVHQQHLPAAAFSAVPYGTPDFAANMPQAQQLLV